MMLLSTQIGGGHTHSETTILEGEMEFIFTETTLKEAEHCTSRNPWQNPSVDIYLTD